MFRILIAEDDPSTARLLCAIVKRAGYEPLTAADGVQALEMLDHNQIDLLLCDVMMPRMDGFTLTRTIRESGSMLPILMLTAKDMPQDKHTGFIVGTDDYMTKPPDRQELVLRIKALLRRARTKGDTHEEHSAAADQRYVRLRQGRAFRHAAGAVAHGLPYPQSADGTCVRYAQLSQVLHP